MPEILSVYHRNEATKRLPAVINSSVNKSQVAIIFVTHVVHNGATSNVHLFLEIVSVHLVVVGAWLAK